MKKRTLLLGVMAALPVVAQDGWKFGLNTGFMKSNVPSPMLVGSYYTSTTGTTANNSEYHNVYAEYGDHNPIGLNASYRKGDNEFGVDFFSTSKEHSSSFDVPAGFTGYGIAYPLPMTTTTKLESMVIDAKWIHHFGMGGHGELNTSLGLRFGSFEHNLDFQPNQGSVNYATQHDRLKLDNNSDMYGLLFGLGYTYPLSASWSIGADLTFAFVQGDLKTTLHEEYFNSSNTPQDSFYDYQNTYKDQVARQMDLHVHLDWQITKLISANVGYRYIDYGKVTALNYPWSYYTYGTETAGAWGLSGFTLGVNFKF